MTEILQPSVPQKINKDLSLADNLGEDVVCNLSSAIVKGKMESGRDFGLSVEMNIRALTYVSEALDIEEDPTAQQGNDNNHAVGLGVMGLHSYLADNQIHYGSKESLDFTNVFFKTLRFYALKASNKLAKEKGQTFKSFPESEYADGSYFDKYLTKFDHDIKTDKVKWLFRDIATPTMEDWLELRQDIIEHGLYNSHLLAIAPNGSISYVAGESASIAPIVNRVEERQEEKTGSNFYPAPRLSDDTIPYYTTAYDMSMLDMIDVYAVATVHVDQGISMSLYVRTELLPGMYPWKPEGGPLSTRDLTLIKLYAYKRGIKTIYYTRQYTEDNEGGVEMSINECASCSV